VRVLSSFCFFKLSLKALIPWSVIWRQLETNKFIWKDWMEYLEKFSVIFLNEDFSLKRFATEINPWSVISLHLIPLNNSESYHYYSENFKSISLSAGFLDNFCIIARPSSLTNWHLFIKIHSKIAKLQSKVEANYL